MIRNYNKQTLGEQAKNLGFVRDTYEKVCRLSEILTFVEEDEYFSQIVALKGGTAINLLYFDLPRLSVDIDFDLVKNYSKEELVECRKIIKDKVMTYMHNLGYILEENKSKNTHALDSYVFAYTNSGGVKDRIKIEINCMLREHIFNPKICSVKEIKGITLSQTLSLNIIEIYGSKISALLTRAAPRDLYDVNRMLTSNFFTEDELNLVRKCVIFYVVLNKDESFEKLDTKEVDKIEFHKIKTDLLPVISKSENKYDLSGTKKYVKERLEQILAMSEKEKEFVKQFYNKNYYPELLFDSDDITERLRKHPMVEWKLLNMK